MAITKVKFNLKALLPGEEGGPPVSGGSWFNKDSEVISEVIMTDFAVDEQGRKYWAAQTAAPNGSSYNFLDNAFQAEVIIETNNDSNKSWSGAALGGAQDSNFEVPSDFHALDTTGNVRVYETTPPTATITNPASEDDYYTNDSNYEVTIQVTDGPYAVGSLLNSGWDRQSSTLNITSEAGDFVFDTSCVTVETTNGIHTVKISAPTTGYPNGKYTVTGKVVDYDGNESAEISKTFTIDTVGPQLTIVAPETTGTIIKENKYTVIGYTDDSTHKVKITVNDTVYDNTPLTENLEESGRFDFSQEVSLNPGNNVIVIYSEDKATNRTQQSFILISDTSMPIIKKVMFKPISGGNITSGQMYELRVYVEEVDGVNESG